MKFCKIVSRIFKNSTLTKDEEFLFYADQSRNVTPLIQTIVFSNRLLFRWSNVYRAVIFVSS